MNDYLIPIFKLISLTFAVASVATGLQANIAPSSFSKSFGIPIQDNFKAVKSSTSSDINHRNVATSYASLMGIRQLATGVTILAFAYQSKWTEIATILSIIGILVAGTDGVYLARSGAIHQALIHAIPGAIIAAIAIAASYSEDI